MADTLIYSILYSLRESECRVVPLARDPCRGPRVMERLAQETGGGYFRVSRDVSIDNIFDQIEDELRHEYSIGYTPDRPATREGEYRRIKLTTVRKGLEVRTRDGYYSK